MNGIDFLQNINDIDADLLAEAEKRPAKKQSYQSWILAAAACIIVSIPAFLLGKQVFLKDQTHETIVCFNLDGGIYEMPRVEDYVNLGLLSEDQAERNSIHLAPLTRQDLGPWMGDVLIQTEDGVMTCKAYHYALMPDRDDVCVIEVPNSNTFSLYVRKEDAE